MHRFLILGLAIRLRNYYRSVKRVIFDLRTSLIEYSLYLFRFITCSACLRRLSLEMTRFLRSKSGVTRSWPASVAPSSGTESKSLSKARSRSNEVTQNSSWRVSNGKRNGQNVATSFSHGGKLEVMMMIGSCSCRFTFAVNLELMNLRCLMIGLQKCLSS